MTLDPHREHITFWPLSGPDRLTVLDPDPERVAIQTTGGHVIDECSNPRASFPLPFDPLTTRWDSIQLAYFTSAAVRNYLTEPFGLA